MRLEAVLFDLDGTLAHSAPDIAAALNIALSEAGLPSLDLAAVVEMVGGGARLLVERALAASGDPAGAVPAEQVLAGFLRAYEATPCLMTVLYPGAREAVAALGARGLRLGVATNKPERLTRAILDRLGISGHFSAIAASRPGLALKPAPDLLLAALADLQVEPAQAILVGDSKADVGAARAAGLRVALMQHGYSREPVEALRPDLVLDGFGEIVDSLGLLRPIDEAGCAGAGNRLPQA